MRNNLDSFHWRGWTLQQLQILSSTKQTNLVLPSTNSTDGCSAMKGKDNGVQARIRNTYPKAVFVHCSSHRLNLVVHDLNYVADVRNTIGTVKYIITFFRDSPKRRRLVANIPLLCETRWSANYKSIRIFSENFCDIYIHNWSNWRQTSMIHRVRVRRRIS